MKEGVPPKEPIDYKLRRLVFQFGCNPVSMRILRKVGDDKFFVILEAKGEDGPKIIKATRSGINVGRLRTESRVLSSLPRDYLEQNGVLIPKLEQELTPYEDLHAIMISKMPKGRNPSLDDYYHVLEVFQKMEIPEELEIRRVEPEDYFRKTKGRLNALRRIGALKGLSDREIERIRQFYEDNLSSLESFDMVFVHGDFKRSHVRKLGDKSRGVHDFDKSVIGSELEDWAWLAVRHPWLSGKIIDHLKEKVFKGNKEKLENLDIAFRLMQIDRLIEGYYTRTYQWRGNLDPFSYVSKTVGRAILDLFLVRT